MTSRRLTLGLATLAAASFALTLEVGLRAMPQLIPLGQLQEFEPHMRSTIARRRQLQTAADTVLVPRDDGGPRERMWLYKPLTDVTLDFDEPGIVKTVRTDALGFCNPEAEAPDVAALDVAALGDSFTWCTNVEPRDAWPSRLSRLTGLRTYNFGLPGRGLYEYLQILKRFALPRKPGVVILDVYEGNDLRDAVRFYDAQESQNGLETGPPCPLGSPLCHAYEAAKRSFVGRHSYAYNFASSWIWRLAYKSHKHEINFQYDVIFPGDKVVHFNGRNGDRDEVAFAETLYDGELALTVFDAALRRFVELSREHGFRPVVAYTPSAYTAYGPRAIFDDATLAGVMRFYSDTQREYFAAKAHELGYAFIDLTPALARAAKASSPRELLYFRSNVHLTQRGHDVVAHALAAFLRKG